MTQTYGYYCPSCSLRWKGSVCKEGKCPSGHDLNDAYSVYVHYRTKRYGGGIDVRITGKDLDFSHIFTDLKALSAFMEQEKQERSPHAAVFINARETSSEDERSWRIKCWMCTFADYSYYPGDLFRLSRGKNGRKTHCQKGHEWCTIYCTDFEKRDFGKNHSYLSKSVQRYLDWKYSQKERQSRQVLVRGNRNRNTWARRRNR
ncbi:MAG: hypothetical protein ACFFD4_02450 [Candidatus Odinarchaeota archaeon]